MIPPNFKAKSEKKTLSGLKAMLEAANKQPVEENKTDDKVPTQPNQPSPPKEGN